MKTTTFKFYLHCTKSPVQSVSASCRSCTNSVLFNLHNCKSVMQLGYAVGSLEINIVSGWRYMYATSVPIALIMGIGMWWLPPSPRWLLLSAVQGKRNVEDTRVVAIDCLCRLRGKAIGDSAPEQVDEILDDLSNSDEGKEASLSEVFHGKCLKALIIGGGLVLFQQVMLLSNGL